MASSVLSKIKGADNAHITIMVLNVILVFTAVAAFIWMSSLRWSDSAGVAVGIIFVGLSVIQIIITVFWMKKVKQLNAEEEVDEDVKEVQMTSMNGSGDCESSGLVKREFPSAEDIRFTEGANKVDVNVVA